MTKKILFISLLATISIATKSQSLEFVYNNGVLANNAVVNITNFTSDDEVGVEMVFNALLQNKTSKDVKVIVRKSEISVPAGSTNTFCTGLGCYTTSASAEYTIAANSNDPLFHCLFSPVAPSTATIKYTASVSGSLGDEVSVTVNYQYAPTGIKEVGIQLLNVIQQNNSFAIQYESNNDIFLKIIDLSGREKARYTLPVGSNKYNLDIQLSKGAYLFVFENNKGNKIAKKIINY